MTVRHLSHLATHCGVPHLPIALTPTRIRLQNEGVTPTGNCPHDPQFAHVELPTGWRIVVVGQEAEVYNADGARTAKIVNDNGTYNIVTAA